MAYTLGLLAYAIGLNAFALVVLMGLAAATVEFPPLWVIAVLALAAALAERQSVTVARGIESSVSFLPLVFQCGRVRSARCVGLVAWLLGNFVTCALLALPKPVLGGVYRPVRSFIGRLGWLPGSVGREPITFAPLLTFVAT